MIILFLESEIPHFFYKHKLKNSHWHEYSKHLVFNTQKISIKMPPPNVMSYWRERSTSTTILLLAHVIGVVQ